MKMNEKMKGNIFNIKKFAVHDGPGIRTTVFFNGCSLSCIWCHNPESRRDCLTDQETNLKSIDQLLEIIEKDRVFYDESDGGVTISGGEPLVQWKFLIDLLKNLKKREIHTVLDTTGFSDFGVFKEVSEYVDLFLYDLKLMDENEHIKYTGVSNKKILKNFEYLSAKGKKIWVRFPLIPGITDKEKNIRGIGSFLLNRKNIDKISVLPYHRLASHKYEKLSERWEMGDIKTPDKKTIKRVCNMFETYGLTAFIGG